MRLFDVLFKRDALAEEVQSLEIRRNLLLHDIADQERLKVDTENKVMSELQHLEELQSATGALNGYVEMQDMGLEYMPLDTNNEEITKKIVAVESDIAKMYNNATVCKIIRTYTLNNSVLKGAKMQKEYSNNLLGAYNNYFEKKKKAITENNYSRTIELLDNTYNRLNKRADTLGMAINYEYHVLCKKLIRLYLDLKLAKEKQRKEQREQKRRLKEQEQLIIEMNRLKKKLEEEKKAMDIAFDKALTDEERESIKENIADIDKRMADADYRLTNTKSGWLYVISSPSLPNLVKVGVSRRESPWTRVRELSSSSLPIPFKAHCFVFSDDCFELESATHKYFDAQRVNKDREFFAITPQQAINALKDHFKVDIWYVDDEYAPDED